MLAMTLAFIAGIIAGITLAALALWEFIRHESRNLRRADTTTSRDVTDTDTASVANYRAYRARRRDRTTARIA